MQRKILLSLVSLCGISIAVACTAGDPTDPNATAGTSASSATSATSATSSITTGDSSTASSGDSAGTGLDLTTGTTTTDLGEDTMRMEECEFDGAGNPVLGPDGMQVCTCIKIATWGALGTYGAVPGADGQDAIVAWLNNNSTGEAEYFPTKPAVTADYLKGFDIILIQDVSKWAPFTPEEKAAFEAWVRAGKGVITLNGYSADGNEMANVNSLIAFSGISYIPASDTANEAQRLAKLGGCEDCYGGAVSQAGWVATHPISANMKQVGAFHGRAVMGGDPVANEFGFLLGATAEVDAGHVFVFHDEWVTYNSQWTGAGLKTDCSDPAMDNYGLCTAEHPLTQFNIPQFWYNAIRWTSGSLECFVIEDETIIR